MLFEERIFFYTCIWLCGLRSVVQTDQFIFWRWHGTPGSKSQSNPQVYFLSVFSQTKQFHFLPTLFKPLYNWRGNTFVKFIVTALKKPQHKGQTQYGTAEGLQTKIRISQDLLPCFWVVFLSFNEGATRSSIWAGWASPQRHSAPPWLEVKKVTKWVDAITSPLKSHLNRVHPSISVAHLWALPRQLVSCLSFLPSLTQIFAHAVWW